MDHGSRVGVICVRPRIEKFERDLGSSSSDEHIIEGRERGQGNHFPCRCPFGGVCSSLIERHRSEIFTPRRFHCAALHAQSVYVD